MFKRLLFLFFVALCIVNTAIAGVDNKVIINAVTLDDNPTSAESISVYMQDSKKTTFFVNYDETEALGVSATVTAQVSYDNANWLSANFYDYAGSSTLQTSETLTTDSWYYFFLNPDLLAPYAKVWVTCTGCSASDTVITSVYEAANK